MLESVPQEALALILPMSIAFFLGLIMVTVTVVFLIKDKAVHPALGLASLGLPAAVGTGYGVVGSNEAEGWVYVASLAPVIALFLALGLFGLLALPLAWKGAQLKPREWRSSLVVWAITFALCFCLYMQAQVQYASLLPIVPDQATPNMVSYFRMVMIAMGGGLLGLMCLGQPSGATHRQMRLIGGGALALLVWVGEVAHTSLLDYIGLNSLAIKVVERSVDAKGAVAGSYAVYEGEALWTAGVLCFGTLMWVYLIVSSRDPEESLVKPVLMACVWFVFPVVSMVGNPVGQPHVEREVVKQVEAMKAEVPTEETEEAPGEGEGSEGNEERVEAP